MFTFNKHRCLEFNIKVVLGAFNFHIQSYTSKLTLCHCRNTWCQKYPGVKIILACTLSPQCTVIRFHTQKSGSQVLGCYQIKLQPNFQWPTHTKMSWIDLTHREMCARVCVYWYVHVKADTKFYNVKMWDQFGFYLYLSFSQPFTIINRSQCLFLRSARATPQPRCSVNHRRHCCFHSLHPLQLLSQTLIFLLFPMFLFTDVAVTGDYHIYQ